MASHWGYSRRGAEHAEKKARKQLFSAPSAPLREHYSARRMGDFTTALSMISGKKLFFDFTYNYLNLAKIAYISLNIFVKIGHDCRFFLGSVFVMRNPAAGADHLWTGSQEERLNFRGHTQSVRRIRPGVSWLVCTRLAVVLACEQVWVATKVSAILPTISCPNFSKINQGASSAQQYHRNIYDWECKRIFWRRSRAKWKAL